MNPRTPEEYFKKTEHAVRHLFSGVDSCLSVYKTALKYWDISKAGRPLSDQEKVDLDRYLDRARQYFDLKFSEATFCGSILQVAFMGIRLCPQNTSVPENCKEIVSADKNCLPFCIGREICGLPVGLIIYAGRNQYNHWNEGGDLRKANRMVFDALALAHANDQLRDLAYDLGNPTITVYASELVLGILIWTTYDAYLAEMTNLLSHAST